MVVNFNLTAHNALS